MEIGKNHVKTLKKRVLMLFRISIADCLSLGYIIIMLFCFCGQNVRLFHHCTRPVYTCEQCMLRCVYVCVCTNSGLD